MGEDEIHTVYRRFHVADETDGFWRSLLTHEEWMRREFRKDVYSMLWFPMTTGREEERDG